ncbi:HAMP domain-containing histidine kinase [Lysobacter sp. A6]|uniref:histidine kinase n=1 Tax=Noviluteimonas lactosilytica TaxID=2888523 RepID=A0ABS8JL73_9GAMM|nr:HAMP domain-containing sensor histidine kinase [Lysobacter lactosilyticus]MCC8364369.1 HAMP domain-containing histidine kinase [Lysobacter lactosilyticus]
MANDASRGDTPWFNRLAHDLRSPLTSLQTAAYLMRTDPGNANAKELADIVVRQSQRMARMIDELDDWSRAEQQRLVDRSGRVELAGTLDMAVGSVHGSTIDPHYGDGTQDAMVLGDAGRLAQMFRTLVEQVVARDPQGARVAVSRRDGSAEVVFADNGPALDDEARARLLVAPQIPPPDDGLGLRLLIAKAIVEAHEGTLAIDGAGDGATQRIRCTLPLA